jgi:hypothetical protein
MFATDRSGAVATRVIGRGATTRPVLVRSVEMEALVLEESGKLVEDWSAGRRRYDGLIYCMGWRDSGSFVPLYIGKTETLGKGDGNLSANLANLTTDRSKFARWGDNYAYHIGDLSACVLPGHAPKRRTVKYGAWASTLFVEGSVVPRRPVYFWAMGWDRDMTGVWEDLGPTRLAFLEYLLIGVAGLVSPTLLNREGIARDSKRSSPMPTAE